MENAGDLKSTGFESYVELLCQLPIRLQSLVIGRYPEVLRRDLSKTLDATGLQLVAKPRRVRKAIRTVPAWAASDGRSAAIAGKNQCGHKLGGIQCGGPRRQVCR